MGSVLGCMDLLYDHLGLACDKTALLHYFGPRWTIDDVIHFLSGYGYCVVQGPPRTGDIVFMGKHPGIVRVSDVETLHHNRRVYVPLRRIKADLVLRCL